MCHEWFTLTSRSGYQALSNAEVCESENASMIKQSRPRSLSPSDSASCRIAFLFDRNAYISRYRHNFSFRKANSFQRSILKPAHKQNNDSLNRYRSS